MSRKICTSSFHDLLRTVIDDPEFRNPAKETGLNVLYASRELFEDRARKTSRISI